jgi:transposase
MSQVTVISGVERRRFWSDEQKRALVMAVSAPGANVAEIARQADLRPGQIYRWRRQMCGTNQGFAAVTVQEVPVVSAPCSAIAVEVGGSTVRISAAASPALVSAVLLALKA